MKNKIFIAIAFLMVVGLFESCTTPPIEAAQEAYDYNAIVPKVLGGIDGTTVAFQTTTAEYSIGYYRGGSTWQWSAEGATVKSVSEDTRSAVIEYPSDGIAKIMVTEITQGGVSSEPASLDVTVNAFCPMTADDFVGTWVGTESVDGGDAEDITMVISKIDENTISIDAQGGTPGLLQSVYTGWGETFQPGFGLEGDIQVTLGLGDGSLSLTSGEYWGQTLPGPYDYWYVGSGTWDGCTSSISFAFEMHWDDGDFSDGGNYATTATLVKQ